MDFINGSAGWAAARDSVSFAGMIEGRRVLFYVTRPALALLGRGNEAAEIGSGEAYELFAEHQGRIADTARALVQGGRDWADVQLGPEHFR